MCIFLVLVICWGYCSENWNPHRRTHHTRNINKQIQMVYCLRRVHFVCVFVFAWKFSCIHIGFAHEIHALHMYLCAVYVYYARNCIVFRWRHRLDNSGIFYFVYHDYLYYYLPIANFILARLLSDYVWKYLYAEILIRFKSIIRILLWNQSTPIDT